MFNLRGTVFFNMYFTYKPILSLLNCLQYQTFFWVLNLIFCSIDLFTTWFLGKSGLFYFLVIYHCFLDSIRVYPFDLFFIATLFCFVM